MEIVEIFTDGSCKGNPGPGGWAVTILNKGEDKPFAIIHGNTLHTTNNRMEMMAVIEALKYIEKNNLRNKKIILHSDSNLVVQTINLGWKRKKNLDLWCQFDSLNSDLSIEYVWVRGHANNRWNEFTDKIALDEAMRAQKESMKKGQVAQNPEPADQQQLF
ncbi:ribonuclease HI [Patescibacteria group bacterium]|nr:ribonuclease HI [Patescibacteria group bacterium]MBU1703413.1 ribonuclease HI [Patescibacteria group bacterium]MBU1953864.1 ribonuclease HI [Patescibacteria group bacterium]